MPSAIDYVKDQDLNLFCRPDIAEFAYSDGESAEQLIYESVCRAGDRTTFSLDLARSIVDWPSEYHLSRERHCIVRPLGIRRGDKVLELGGGCGAITRFLGELGAAVTAVEGSFKRARIAAERCRDLPNVKVVVDDLLAFQTNEHFQWVLLIGVLEYASVFSDRKDPAQHHLRTTSRFLTATGRLVVAIENKLGLKYFNGLAEDHLGIPFAGIQGLYGERTASTFGRRELELKIKAAGLPHFKFYYPFPDYKLPRVIFSERALSEEGFDSADLLAKCVPRDYCHGSLRVFDDALVNNEVAKNGLLADLSNSFLVVASRFPFPPENDELATTFAASRARQFATQTRFVHSGNGIQVIKDALDSGVTREVTLKDGWILKNLLESSKYVSGRLLYWRLLVARARYGGHTESVDALRPWFQFILNQVIDSNGHNWKSISDMFVPGRALDLTPFNLIDGDQGIVAIDNEWAVDRDIPLAWVVTRSLLHALSHWTDFEGSTTSVQDVIRSLCSESGLVISDLEIEDCLNREAEACGGSTADSFPSCWWRK